MHSPQPPHLHDGHARVQRGRLPHPAAEDDGQPAQQQRGQQVDGQPAVQQGHPPGSEDSGEPGLHGGEDLDRQGGQMASQAASQAGRPDVVVQHEVGEEDKGGQLAKSRIRVHVRPSNHSRKAS